MKEPSLVVYKDGDSGSEAADISSNGSVKSDESENVKNGRDMLERNGDCIVTFSLHCYSSLCDECFIHFLLAVNFRF